MLIVPWTRSDENFSICIKLYWLRFQQVAHQDCTESTSAACTIYTLTVWSSIFFWREMGISHWYCQGWVKIIDGFMSYFCVLAYFLKFIGQGMFKMMTLPGVKENKGKASLLVSLSCSPVCCKITFNAME